MEQQYTAQINADVSGYVSSLQSAVAQTQQFISASEGAEGALGRAAGGGIQRMNQSLGITSRMMKTNVSEAASYQQALGGVSARAVAAGRSVTEVSRATRDLAQGLTGSIDAAADIVKAAQNIGYSDLGNLRQVTQLMVEVSASTGEAGGAIVQSLQSIERAFGGTAAPERMRALADGLVKVTATFGGSAQEAAGFAAQIAPFAEQTGLSQEAVLGLSTAFSRMGEAGRRSSTVFSKVLTDIDAAVREGAPTLQLYADTMGITTAQAKELAESGADQFFVNWVKSISTGGDDAIRSLDLLVGDGVRAQKTLRTLASSGDLESMISEASAAMGSGVTTASAQEQIEGLSESFSRLSETMRQTVANSGAPLLNAMQGITDVSQTALSGVEKLTGSSGFQSLMAVLGYGSLAFGVAGKGLSAAFTAGSLSPLGRMAGDRIRERSGSMAGFLKDNKGLLLKGGIGATAVGAATGNDMFMTLGTLGLLASSGIGEMAFRGVRGLSLAGLRDAGVALNNPELMFTGRHPKVEERVAEGLTGYRQMTPMQQQEALGRVTADRRRTEDARVLVRQRIKGLKSGRLDDLFKTLSSTVDATGSTLAGADTIAALAEMAVNDPDNFNKAQVQRVLRAEEVRQAQAGDLDRGNNDGGAGRRKYNTLLAKDQAGDILGGSMRTLAYTMGRLGTLLANPVTLGVGAAVGGAALFGTKLYQEQQQRDKRGVMDVEGANKIAAAYGMPEVKFRGLASATDKVTSSFEQLADSLQGTSGFASAESYRQLSTAGLTQQHDFRYQNFMIGNMNFRNSRVTPEGTAEILAMFGTTGSADERAAITTELKLEGKSEEEYAEIAGALEEYYRDGGRQILDLAVENLYTEGFGDNELGSQLIKRFNADRPGLTAEQGASMLVDSVLDYAAEKNLSDREIKEGLEYAFESAGLDTENLPELPKANDVESDARGRFREEWERNGDGWVNKTTGEQVYTDTKYSVPEGARRQSDVLNEYETEARQDAVDAWIATLPTDAQVGDNALRFAQSGLASGMSPLSTVVNLGYEGAVGADEGPRPVYVAQDPYLGNDPLDEGTRSAFDALSGFADDISELSVGDVAGQTQLGASMADFWLSSFGGDTASALADLQTVAMGATPGTPQAAAIQVGVQSLQGRQQIEYMGMSPLAANRAQQKAIGVELGNALQLAGGDMNSPAVQEAIKNAQPQIQQLQAEAVAMQQNILRQRRQFDLSMAYQQEDYKVQVQQANQDHYIQMQQQEEDYQRGMARSERDYNKQRLRTMDDFAKQIGRRAEDAAKSMYDPFQRIKLESTWSGQGLAQNMKEQLEMFERQAESLDKLREMGLDQSVIDVLGLNDPGKAQQAYRLLEEAGTTEGTGFIDELNRMAAAREDVAGVLFGEENDMGARRMAEDFALSLERMHEDRQQWLADSQADYELSVERSSEAFNRMMDRMADAHRRGMDRAREQFTESFAVYTSDMETLEAATTAAMDENATVHWPEIVTKGIDAQKEAWAEGTPGLLEDIENSISSAVAEEFGEDSELTDAIATLMALFSLNQATGGGYDPGGSVADYKPEYDWRDLSGDKLRVTDGVGRVTRPYNYVDHEVYNNPQGRHTGIDIGAARNTPVFSTMAGEVMFARDNGAYGNQVAIVNDNLGTFISFAHLESMSVRPGQKVSYGQMVGRVGSSGTSTGPHLHFEVRKKGPDGEYKYDRDNIDPVGYLYTGGIVNRPGRYMVGEGGPEAVIPFDGRGIDALAGALEMAFGKYAGGGLMPGGVVHHSSTVVNEDHRVMVSGPITVEASDPEAMARALQRKARQRALLQVGRSS